MTWPENNSVSSGDKITVGTAIGECVYRVAAYVCCCVRVELRYLADCLFSEMMMFVRCVMWQARWRCVY